MEITSTPSGDTIDVALKGRLDGYWADHLSQALEETLRRGYHHIRLNMAEVAYLSSLGIRVLVTFFKKAEAIEGTLTISESSDAVKKVLDMVGLTSRLMPAAKPAASPAAAAPVARVVDGANASFEVFDLGGAQPLGYEAIGNSALLNGCRFTDQDCRKIALPETSFAIGLGAFGQEFSECSGRFGEFLSVAGAAAYQPTDGSNVPDFLLAEGSLIPEMQVLYGALCSGPLNSLARFESKPDRAAVGFAEVVAAALDIAGADQAGIVCVAESAGLVGASLRRSPVNGSSSAAPFGHPEIRQWLSFTTERAYSRAIAVVAGIASRSASGPLGPLLRPLAGADGVCGHFHAAAFSYRPLQRGVIELKKTVRSLFEHETLQGILHLIGDDRDAVGVSESEFVRGACWIGALRSQA
jgi:anti-anti-sigma factor